MNLNDASGDRNTSVVMATENNTDQTNHLSVLNGDDACYAT